MYGGLVAKYSVLDHTADTGIEATAGSLPDLVEALAMGMFELMADMGTCSSTASAELAVSADTDEDLVYEALSELLYTSDVEDLLFCDFEIEVSDERSLRIEARGIPSKEAEVTGPPIKAVTYHDIEVTENEDGWHGRVYFDV